MIWKWNYMTWLDIISKLYNCYLIMIVTYFEMKDGVCYWLKAKWNNPCSVTSSQQGLATVAHSAWVHHRSHSWRNGLAKLGSLGLRQAFVDWKTIMLTSEEQLGHERHLYHSDLRCGTHQRSPNLNGLGGTSHQPQTQPPRCLQNVTTGRNHHRPLQQMKFKMGMVQDTLVCMYFLVLKQWQEPVSYRLD